MPRIDPELPLRRRACSWSRSSPSHATALFEALQAPELYTYIPQDPPSSLEALTAAMQPSPADAHRMDTRSG